MSKEFFQGITNTIQNLFIPTASATPPSSIPSNSTNSIIVQSGDTLGALGAKHDFDYKEAQIVRDGKFYKVGDGQEEIDPARIRPGDKIVPPSQTVDPIKKAAKAAEEQGTDQEPEKICATCPTHCDYKEFFWKNILKHEGGYVDDPVDRGGKTNYGVTYRTWEEYSKKLFGIDANEDTLRKITLEQAFEIYRIGYWIPSGADRIKNCPLAFQVSDIAYNSGARGSTKILQRAINDLGGNIAEDGAIGSKTIAAANSLSAPDLYRKVREHRWMFYEAIMQNNPSQEKFRNGWRNRTESFNHY